MSLDTTEITSNLVAYTAVNFLMDGKLPTVKESVEVLIVEVAGAAVAKSKFGNKVFGVIPEPFPELISLRDTAAVYMANGLMGALTDKEASDSRIMKIVSSKVVAGLLKQAGLDLSTI